MNLQGFFGSRIGNVAKGERTFNFPVYEYSLDENYYIVTPELTTFDAGTTNIVKDGFTFSGTVHGALGRLWYPFTHNKHNKYWLSESKNERKYLTVLTPEPMSIDAVGIYLDISQINSFPLTTGFKDGYLEGLNPATNTWEQI